MKKMIVVLTLLFLHGYVQAGTNADSLFTESPVVLHTATGDILGTLMTPLSSNPCKSVALIIAGSGPTDRNGNNPMMKNESLKLLAQGLAAQGIASLRYDKRGIAASKAAGKSEADLRFENYVDDAKDWIKMLRQDKRFKKLIVVGHSEGSLIGMIAAQQMADGFVSIAGAGRSADKILKEQLANQPGQVKDLCYPIIDSLAAGKQVSDVNPMLYSLFRPAIQPYMISWFHYDPAVEIKKLSIPVLIVQGDKDIQVSLEDARLLQQAAPKAKLVVVEKMNHIFKIVEGDTDANVATYKDPSIPVSEELIKAVAGFITKQ